MPGRPPYGWQEQLEIRDFIEAHMEQAGWRSLGAGYGFGVADVLLCKAQDGMEVHVQFFVGRDDVEIQVMVHEPDEDDV